MAKRDASAIEKKTNPKITKSEKPNKKSKTDTNSDTQTVWVVWAFQPLELEEPEVLGVYKEEAAALLSVISFMEAAFCCEDPVRPLWGLIKASIAKNATEARVVLFIPEGIQEEEGDVIMPYFVRADDKDPTVVDTEEVNCVLGALKEQCEIDDCHICSQPERVKPHKLGEACMDHAILYISSTAIIE